MATLPWRVKHRAIQITDVEAVSSYDCMELNPHVIVVPGMPPKWLGRRDKPLLKHDDVSRSKGQNASGWRPSSMEAVVRAVLHQRPDFDFSGLDMIVDRFPLTRLLDFAVRRDDTTLKTIRPNFTFGAQVVNGTVILMHLSFEAKPPEIQKEFKGFRQDFMQTHFEHSTGLGDGVSHYRISTYSLGDLHLMLRTKADGYIPEDSAEMRKAPEFATESSEEKQERFDEVTVKSGGTLIPCSAMLELKSYHDNGKVYTTRLTRKFRDTWLTQQPNLIFAAYTIKEGSGEQGFEKLRAKMRVKHHKADEEWTNWETNNQQQIKAFYYTLQNLVKRIRTAVANGQGNTFTVDCAKGSNQITITPSTDIPGIPAELCERLKKGKESMATS